MAIERCLFCWPDYTHARWNATFAGGDWEEALPLTNLRDRRLARVARSSDASDTSARFTVDLGTARSIRAAALIAHNLTLAGQVRVTASSSSGFTGDTYDSGWVAAYPVIYPADVLPVGHPSYSTRKLTQAEWDAGRRLDFIRLLDTPVEARYWGVEIDDQSNPDGYVEIGRLVLAWAYEPSVSIQEGAQVGWESTTQRVETDGGASYFRARRPRRSCVFTLPQMDVDEALSLPFELTRELSTGEQFLFVRGPIAAEHLQRSSFLATLQRISPFQLRAYRYVDSPWAVIEEI